MDTDFINGVYTGLSFRSLLTYGSQLDHNNVQPLPPSSAPPYLLPLLPTTQQKNNEKAKKRREKLSNKTRILHKLLPMGRKGDMATVLEESYKYIKFLEAQVKALESMPRVSDGFVGGDGENCCSVVGDLGKLNRQELLQVVVNSEKAQGLLYFNECCVYSVEQLVKLKDNNISIGIGIADHQKGIL